MSWQPIETAPEDGLVEWKPVPGLPGVEAHIFGHVVDGERVLSQHRSTKGYMRVTVRGREMAVHRLVAMAHVPNPLDRAEVNHKDGVKSNNNADNLEWVTRSENMKHAYAKGLHPGVKLRGAASPNFGRNGKRHPQSMPVRATFADGRVQDFESQGLAAEAGFLPPKISACINGRRKHHGGATWQALPPTPGPGVICLPLSDEQAAWMMRVLSEQVRQ